MSEQKKKQTLQAWCPCTPTKYQIKLFFAVTNSIDVIVPPFYLLWLAYFAGSGLFS